MAAVQELLDMRYTVRARVIIDIRAAIARGGLGGL
jgi:hypothetical protein